MTVSTVSRCKNRPSSFFRHTISNQTLGCRFKVHVNANLNIQTEHGKGFVSLKVVHACRPLQAKTFQNLKRFQNQSGTNLPTMHIKTDGGVLSVFKIVDKKEIQRRHGISFYSPVVKMPNLDIKHNNFVNLEQMKTTESVASTSCSTE